MSELEQLTQLLQVYQILGQLFQQHEDSLIWSILPSCTEEFLTEAGKELDAMLERIKEKE